MGALLLEKTAGLRLLWGYCGERGRVAMYSTPSAYGLVFSWKGRNHTVEQEAPFDADEVITKASEWANKLENRIAKRMVKNSIRQPSLLANFDFATASPS